MPFPSSPTNGQTYVLNNTSYTYNSALGTWTATQAGVSTPIVIAANTAATSATTGALQVVGGIGVLGNIYTASTVVMGSPFTMRNKIINGAMTIDQRNAGASVTPTDGQFTVDRWQVWCDAASKLTTQQSTTVPNGYKNSVLITSTSAYSITATQQFGFLQPIEGLNVIDLAWGTSAAKSITISFWVRSSLTGTFGGAIRNSAGDRFYVFSYLISSADTWEQKTVTIVGDTTGTWLTTNGVGLYIYFSLGAGSSKVTTSGSWGSTAYYGVTGQQNLVANNAATLYITGVQLEVGTAATPFENRIYSQELALCQRYYYNSSQLSSGSNNGAGFFGYSTDTSNVYGIATFPVTMRSSPTITIYDDSNTSGTLTFPGVSNAIAATVQRITTSGFNQFTGTFTASKAAIGRYTANAEL